MKPSHARGLEHAAAERVRDARHVPRAPRRAGPARRARESRAQLDRIAEVVVEPPQDRVHALQARERLQVDVVAAHGEVVPLDERQAEMTREVRVLEVRLVERAGRQHDGERRLVRRGWRQQPIAQAGEERADERPHLISPSELGKDARDDLPVLERIARTGRRLRAIAEHPPAPVGRAREIDGVDVQPRAAGRAARRGRPQEVRMTERQLRRNDALREQLLRAVEIGEQRIEQLRPLRDARLDPPPLARRNEERQEIERPRTIAALRIGVDVVGDAVLDDEPARKLDAAARGIGPIDPQPLDQRAPVRADVALVIEQLVVAASLACIGVETARDIGDIAGSVTPGGRA